MALEESNLGDLRKMVHKDAAGNIISEPPKLYKPMFDQWTLIATCSADPDRANPTRPRLERPLETIMSFQRNIDYTDHTRRSPYAPGPGIPFPAIAKQQSDFGCRLKDGLSSSVRSEDGEQPTK